MKQRFGRGLLLALLLAGALPAGAQDLPAADEVIAAYVQAIGGRDAHLAPTSMRQSGSVSISGLGIQGTFEILTAVPDRFRMGIAIPGVGEILTGYDGQTGWTTNPLVGAAIMQGEELEMAKDNANWRAMLRDADLIPVRETVEAATFAGQSCWKVRLQWASGRESFDCYSQESRLLVASEETQVSPMGAIPVTMLYSDYREVQGMILPRRMTQSSAGQTLEITIDSVEINAVSEAAFELPAAVRALLGNNGGD
jgi:outer membrane lipoprotein-sorting protein